MRSQVLNALKQGISRIRTKGGADPSTLYDLVNGYVTIDGSVVSRPGTTQDVELPSGTKGLCAYNGGLLVFSNATKEITDTDYSCDVLVHPDDATKEIVEIHFAAPFMGYPYVVAEFEGGDVYHFWLQGGETWAASTMYTEGSIVQPSTPNGLAYQASGDERPPAWQPGTAYAVGDEVQPTVYNGFKYTVTAVAGDNPTSSNTEPTWPESEDGVVVEYVDHTPAPTAPTAPSNPGGDRYSNLPGYKQDLLS